MPTAADAASHLWFLGTEVTIRKSHSQASDGISIIEHHAAHAASPPLHIHHNEDEIFHILEGEIRLRVGDEDLHAGVGDTSTVPRGVPHSYRVESAGGARWLTIVRGAEFEGFVRSVGHPAGRDGLPDPEGEPSPEQVRELAEIGRRHGLEFVGPPLR
jgi:mannose-6-phosphate isomerase-like protein (cupin superfamily)